MKYYLCLDVGGTEIKYNVLDESGKFQRKTLSVRTPMPGKKRSIWKSTRIKLRRSKTRVC